MYKIDIYIKIIYKVNILRSYITVKFRSVIGTVTERVEFSEVK